MNSEKMYSLYDYLGRPAGPILGAQVHKEAVCKKELVEVRYVSNRKYTGNVMLYRHSFLKEYFKNKEN